MSFLKLTYCHLIKIILSQVGGNPLQQVYSQLSQGLPMISARSGILPQGLSEVKNLIETVTNVINAAQQAVGDFSDSVERIGAEFYQNPMAAPLAAANAAIQLKITDINSALAISTSDSSNVTLLAQRESLSNTAARMAIYKNNTDSLSGVGKMSGSAAAGGCSLQDLLGSGCAPNNDVPDVDLQQLVDSLRRGDAVAALAERIQSASGFSDYEQAMVSLREEINGFNLAFNNTINKAAVRNAVTAQLTQIVFNLLSGCGNQVLDLTLKSNIKSTISTYATAIQQQQATNEYFSANGETVVAVTPNVTPVVSSIVIDNKPDTRKWYVNGLEVTEAEYNESKRASTDFREKALNTKASASVDAQIIEQETLLTTLQKELYAVKDLPITEQEKVNRRKAIDVKIADVRSKISELRLQAVKLRSQGQI
jgi:hypothetical protein